MVDFPASYGLQHLIPNQFAFYWGQVVGLLNVIPWDLGMMRHAPPILSTLYPMSRYERIPETSIAPENQWLEVKMSF